MEFSCEETGKLLEQNHLPFHAESNMIADHYRNQSLLRFLKAENGYNYYYMYIPCVGDLVSNIKLDEFLSEGEWCIYNSYFRLRTEWISINRPLLTDMSVNYMAPILHIVIKTHNQLLEDEYPFSLQIYFLDPKTRTNILEQIGAFSEKESEYWYKVLTIQDNVSTKYLNRYTHD